MNIIFESRSYRANKNFIITPPLIGSTVKNTQRTYNAVLVVTCEMTLTNILFIYKNIFFIF